MIYRIKTSGAAFRAFFVSFTFLLLATSFSTAQIYEDEPLLIRQGEKDLSFRIEIANTPQLCIGKQCPKMLACCFVLAKAKRFSCG
jgi:hypothetical protein